MKQIILKLVKTVMLERPGKRAGLDALERKLSEGKTDLLERFAGAAGTELERKKLRHIIAIERWGQRRLQVVLGEDLLEDENYAYKPERETSWQDLQKQFADTRGATLQLVTDLRSADPQQSVPHNTFGPLSVTGWLAYLNSHAKLEGKRIKPST